MVAILFRGASSRSQSHVNVGTGVSSWSEVTLVSLCRQLETLTAIIPNFISTSADPAKS